jgi:hypothetical protein
VHLGAKPVGAQPVDNFGGVLVMAVGDREHPNLTGASQAGNAPA